MTKTYDPRSAFLGMKEGLRLLKSKSERQQVPLGLVASDGSAMASTQPKGPATCCVLLLGFINRHPMVPDDFHNVERTSDGIKQYVRPDGGVFLGTFELPKQQGSAVLVYGDPSMTQEEAAAASLAYRRKLQESYEQALALRLEEVGSRPRELTQ